MSRGHFLTYFRMQVLQAETLPVSRLTGDRSAATTELGQTLVTLCHMLPLRLF